MLLVGICKKCAETIKLDVGDMTLEQTKEKLKIMHAHGFECPGHHVETDQAHPLYWDLDTFTFEEGAAPTDEEFLADLRSKYSDVRDTQGMSGLIKGFAYGTPITNDDHNWNFCQAPSGKRWYYRTD